MTRYYSSTRSAVSPSTQTGDSGRQTKPDPLHLDAFVSNVYLPHVKLRKRSWRVDQRIARQHLSPTFGARELAGIQCHEVENWLHGLWEKGLAPATCNRILATFKTICSLKCAAFCPPDNRRARASRPSKSTHSANVI